MKFENSWILDILSQYETKYKVKFTEEQVQRFLDEIRYVVKENLREFGDNLKRPNVKMDSGNIGEDTKYMGYNQRNSELDAQIDKELSELDDAYCGPTPCPEYVQFGKCQHQRK